MTNTTPAAGGKQPSAAYFTDRCGRAVEVKRDTWAMCGLENGHEGPCEPVKLGEQTVSESDAAWTCRQ